VNVGRVVLESARAVAASPANAATHIPTIIRTMDSSVIVNDNAHPLHPGLQNASHPASIENQDPTGCFIPSLRAL
jgi:hypothetical protein